MKLHRKIMYGLTIVLSSVFMMVGCSDDKKVASYTGWAVGMNVGGYGTIIRTTDSGKTWKREGNAMTIPDVSINDVSAIDQLNVWAVGGSIPHIDGTSYGTILRSNDAGESWERQGTSKSIPDEEFIGISAVNNQLAWSVGTGGVIMYTDDGGSNWHQQAEGSFTDVDFEMISAVDKNNVWAVGGVNGSDALIAKTTNGGENWEQVFVDSLENVEVLIDVHAVTADIVWAVGTSGTVVITINGGKTWVRTGPGGLLHVNGVCALDENRAWIAVDSYTLYYTSDGGFSWTQQNMPPPTGVPGLSGAYMGVTAMNEHNAWVVGLNTPSMEDRPLVLHTMDGGEEWTEQFSPANAELRRVSFVGDVK